MFSNVYFIQTDRDDDEYSNKIIEIVEKTGFYDNLNENEEVVLKIHLRDLYESEYVNMDTLKNIKEKIIFKNSMYRILGSDTLFHSKQNENPIDDLIKTCDLKEQLYIEDETINVDCNNEIFTSIPILKTVCKSDSMIVMSHFKGHSMIGFSGSLKNLATGCTNTDGQIMLHKLVQPFVSKIACLACNVCVDVCPENTIAVESVAKINKELCSGCNICITSCPKNAIKLNKIESQLFMEGLMEFSASYLKNKKDNKVLFINILINIKPYYDCNYDTNEVLSNDIGIVASFDPVAIDVASYDLVNNTGIFYTGKEDDVKDKFKEIWRNVDGTMQFDLAEKKGLGTRKYKLIEL